MEEITKIKEINKKNCGKLSKNKLSRFLNFNIPFDVYGELLSKFNLLSMDSKKAHKKLTDILYNKWHKNNV